MKQGKPLEQELRWRVLELWSQGLSGRLIASRLGISHSAVYRIVKGAKSGMPFLCPGEAI